MDLNQSSNLERLVATGLPQTLLFLGTQHTHGLAFIHRLIQHVLCEASKKPCGNCRQCHFLKHKTHPDVVYVHQEKPSAAIKIDQIRALQHDIYRTPQCSAHRLVVIHPADELNRAAANALLKILEEPPKHVIFMLLARHLDTLPATLVSRCQKMYIPEPEPCVDKYAPGYLALGLHYDATSSRGALFKHQLEMAHQLCDLSEGQASVCKLASAWSSYTLNDCLWFFQLFVSTLLQHQLMPEQVIFSDTRVQALAERFSPVHFFKQLDIILKLTRDLNRDIPLNPTLALETLLMGYT
jgi:DNA polymerase III subunit delta'